MVDGVVDGLARLLAPDEDAIDLRIGEGVGIAATACPVLHRTGSAPFPEREVAAAGPIAAQRVSRRGEVFAALSAAFAKVAARRGGLRILLDDLQ